MGGQLRSGGAGRPPEPGAAIALAVRGDAVAAVESGGALGHYDAEGKRTTETALPPGAVQALPFADAWLVRVPGATHLAPSNAKPVKGKLAVFADGPKSCPDLYRMQRLS